MFYQKLSHGVFFGGSFLIVFLGSYSVIGSGTKSWQHQWNYPMWEGIGCKPGPSYEAVIAFLSLAFLSLSSLATTTFILFFPYTQVRYEYGTWYSVTCELY